MRVLMNTLRFGRDARIVAAVLETNYIWGKTISDAMSLASEMERMGWVIQGNPAPMSWNGQYGTGISITRIKNG